MAQPQSTPKPVFTTERKPGRSFNDPSRPMGEKLLEQTGPSTTDPKLGDLDGRVYEGGAPPNGVAERAKAISVMRKAEELMSSDIPPPADIGHVRRAFELAGGRLGLKIGEYDAIVKGDPELMELQRKVIESALRSR